MTHKCVQNSFLRELDVTFLLLIVIETENCGKVKVQRRWVKHFDANFVDCFGKSGYLFKTIDLDSRRNWYEALSFFSDM